MFKDILHALMTRRAEDVRRVYGDLLTGNCPRCGAAVCSAEDKCACGQRIKFPRATPKLEGVRSLPYDEWRRRL